MNMYVYETDKSAVIVDCGVKFAYPDDPSVDLIIPDFSYLETIKDKLECVVVTHAHEDHCGALPYLLQKYDIPVAASRYSMGIIDNKLKDFSLSADKTYIEPNLELLLGDISVTFIPVSHSILGTGALLIRTDDGFLCLHISDFKVDFAPPASEPFNLKPFLELREAGLGCLMCDSTNAYENAFTKGERSVIKSLDKVFDEANGRVFFTTFASNTERIQTVINIAVKHGRKIAIEGASLLKHIEIARSLGKIRIESDIIVPRKSIERLPDHEVCVIATGSQGEIRSAISKISKSDYADIKVRADDVFIFSSRIIPGNEQLVINIMNNIASNGGRSVTVDDEQVHVSGHASKEDIKLLIKLTNPEYFIPIHGERIHLNRQKEIARQAGLSEDKVIITHTGHKMHFEDGLYIAAEEVPSGRLFVDAKEGFLMTLDDLKRRKKLAQEGVVFIFVTADLKAGRIVSTPKIGTEGFFTEHNELKMLANEIKELSDTEVFERFDNEGWTELITKAAKRHFKRKHERKPIINIMLDTVNGLI